ncbi:MAG: OmpA-like protein, partial [Bacteroidota bacterium]|nr:OmpA-like protein [Bacteroidota bacterium]
MKMSNYLIKPILLFFVIIGTYFSGYAQSGDTTVIRAGAFFQYGLNFHSADFRELPQCPSCSPGFESGSGSGFALGAILDYRIAKPLYLSVRIGYYSLGGLLKRTESTTVLVDDVLTPGEFEHSIDASISAIAIEPSAQYYVFDNFSLNLGFNLGYQISGAFEQKETITKPADKGVFVETMKKTRNEVSGDLKDLSALNFSIGAGAG